MLQPNVVLDLVKESKGVYEEAMRLFNIAMESGKLVGMFRT
jgi:hypothetical protein